MAIVVALPAAADLPGIPTEGAVTSQHVDEALAAIEDRTDLDDETKAEILQYLRDAGTQVEDRIAAESAAQDYATALETAPAETARLLEALAEEPPAVTADDLGLTGDESLPQLEQALAQASGRLATISDNLSDLEEAVASTRDRPADARERITEIRVLIEELETSLAAAPPPDEPELVRDARTLATEQRLLARRAELEKLDDELLSQNVRLALLSAERDTAAREQTEQQRRVDLMTALVNERRLESAEEAQLDAAAVEQQYIDAHPALQQLAQGNADLTRELPVIARGIEDTTTSLARAEEMAKNLDRSLARSRQRLEIAGASQAMGQLLSEERRALPQVARYRDELRRRRETLSTIGLAQVRIEEERRELTSIAARADVIMQQVEADVADRDELARLREEARELLRNRRELLNQTSASYSTYLSALGELDVAQRRALDTATDYREFLSRNLVWLPSAPPVGIQTLIKSGDALTWFLSPASWSETVTAAMRGLRSRPLVTFAAVLLLICLFAARRPLAARNDQLDQRVGRLSTDSIWLTLQSLAIAALRVLPVPLTIWFLGLALLYSPDPVPFTLGVSSALMVVAPFLYNSSLFRELCAPDGVAEVHFGWKPANLAILRRQFYLLIVLGVPLAFVAVTHYRSDVPAYQDSIGRLAFVALLSVFALILHPIVDPRRGLAAGYYKRDPKSWMSRLRWVWYALAVGSPVGLAVLALIGYLYTAGLLTGDLIDTLWLILAIVIIDLIVLRWLSLSRRQILWKAAVAKREARKAGTQQDEPTVGAEGAAPAVQVKALDIDAVDQQMRRLLQTLLMVLAFVGLTGIWAETLPALKVLGEINLWSTTEMIDGAATVDAVTLADLTMAVLILVATVVGARNLPGLTEFAILKHFDLQPGSRYTFNTLLRYLVVTIGVVSVLNIIGLPWSRVQWLVAALGVGLGFGLQEIVANFVSGLIILFERPVRIGDTVTVGSLTGKVSQVRIRATTITDWDRKEIIVPNKAFITEQVVNWTLTDPITRVVIEVSIAYGSDVTLAHRVMEETLKANPLILDEPEPKAYFLGFGDSSLNFKLYMYSRELGDRFPIMHSVHNDILDALRRNDIEIPYPQHDLHIRSTVEGGGRDD